MKGSVRSDGETLIPQPHLSTEPDKLWTVADLRAFGVEIQDPLRRIPADQVRLL